MTSLLTVLQGSADGIGSVRRFILCWLPMIPMLMRYCMAPAFTVIVALGLRGAQRVRLKIHFVDDTAKMPQQRFNVSTHFAGPKMTRTTRNTLLISRFNIDGAWA